MGGGGSGGDNGGGDGGSCGDSRVMMALAVSVLVSTIYQR